MGQIDIFTVLDHDLKSPLNAVEQYLEIIRTKALGGSVDPYVEIAERSIGRLSQMRELITDLVDWAKIQSLDPFRPMAEMDLSEAIRTAVEACRTEAEARKIGFATALEDGLVLKGASREIQLILRHLIRNAVKYGKEKGTVSLTAGKAGRRILITISDDGIGLTEQEQGMIFQEFVRIRNSQTQGIVGTGLGLAIAKKLTGNYNGTLSVESEPGKGSTFTLEFPAA